MEVRGGAAQQVSVEERMREEQSYGKKGHVLRSRRKSVLIRNTCSGRASGSQCSSGTILWSLRKSYDFLAKWQ